MAAPHSPIGSRRRLGAELRRLRTRSGLTLEAVAERMTCSTSKISRLETGKGIPKVPDVRELMRIYGVSSDTEQDMLLRLVHDGREHGWWEPLIDGVQPERYVLDSAARYVALEDDATMVRTFDITLVHGLLQTPDYARAVLSSLLPGHGAAEIDKLVTLRVTRQEALRRTDPPPLRLSVIIDESVLHRVVGGVAVMAEQLARIRDVAAMANVQVRVLPFAAGITRVHAGQFVLLEFPRGSGADVVYLEGSAGEAMLDAAADVDTYREVHADALSRCLSAADSMAMIDACRARHARQGALNPRGRSR